MGQILNGSNLIKELYKGSTPVKEVWIGNTKIFPTGTGGGGGSSGDQGFVYDVTPVVISKTTSNPSGGSTTNTTYVKFLANGYMDFDGATTSITWSRWNTNVGALVTPKVKFGLAGVEPAFSSIEVSTNGGSTWATIVQGTEYSLASGVWLRLVKTSTASSATTVPNIIVTYVNNSVEISSSIDMTITSAVNVSANPFVTNFGTIPSEVRTPWTDEAVSDFYIYGRTHPITAGKIVVGQALALGDPKEYAYYDWVVPSETAPSGTYDVVLSGFSVVTNGTYSLTDTGEVYFFISAQGISSTVGQTVTDSGTVAIRKDSVTVSSGTITLYARSQGVIV
tara:strand:+ start:401 stop:1411 length:1011 start_codon:yes stop_codon:yes gene_type:complete